MQIHNLSTMLFTDLFLYAEFWDHCNFPEKKMKTCKKTSICISLLRATRQETKELSFSWHHRVNYHKHLKCTDSCHEIHLKWLYCMLLKKQVHNLLRRLFKEVDWPGQSLALQPQESMWMYEWLMFDPSGQVRVTSFLVVVISWQHEHECTREFASTEYLF